MCDHKDFKAEVNVTRLTDDSGSVTGYTTDISVHCASCMMPFKWIGVSPGASTLKPMVDFEGIELRAPIEPYKK